MKAFRVRVTFDVYAIAETKAEAEELAFDHLNNVGAAGDIVKATVDGDAANWGDGIEFAVKTAIDGCHADIVANLLPHVRTDDGREDLFSHALLNGDLDVIEVFLKAGVDLGSVSAGHISRQMLPEAGLLLIANGWKPNQLDLHAVVEATAAAPDLVKAILDLGVVPLEKTKGFVDERAKDSRYKALQELFAPKPKTCWDMLDD